MPARRTRPGRRYPGRAPWRVLAGPGHGADAARQAPSCRPPTAPVSRTSRRPASTPVVTAQWVRIQNGNRPRTGRPDPRRPRTRNQGPRPDLFCRPGPTDQTSTTGPAKREGMAPMQWPDASFEAVAVIEAVRRQDAEHHGPGADRGTRSTQRCPGRPRPAVHGGPGTVLRRGARGRGGGEGAVPGLPDPGRLPGGRARAARAVGRLGRGTAPARHDRAAEASARTSSQGGHRIGKADEQAA